MNIPPELQAKIMPWCLAAIKEGRGTGEKENYRPFIETYEMRGHGKRTMVASGKFSREHHTMSGIETDLCMILDFSSLVEDIREQFPLDFNQTWKIAAELGFAHPGEKGLYSIMTTDIRITMGDGTEKVRTVKTKEALSVPRTLEKLQIEQVYFSRNGITDWGIVTPGEIDQIYLKNVRQLRGYRSLSEYALTPLQIARIRACLSSHLERFSCLSDCATSCDEALALDEGQALAVAKHLIATKEWVFDLSTPFDPREPGQHRKIIFERPDPKSDAA